MIMIRYGDVTAERRHYKTHCPLNGKRLTTFCASLRSGGHRLAVRTAMGCQIGVLPCTPFASSRRSPQGETRDMRRKTASHILHVPFRRFPPLVAGATTFPPQFGGAAKGKRLNGQARRLTSPHLEVLCRTSTGDYKAPLCCELLMKGLLFRALFCPRLRAMLLS